MPFRQIVTSAEWSRFSLMASARGRLGAEEPMKMRAFSMVVLVYLGLGEGRVNFD